MNSDHESDEEGNFDFDFDFTKRLVDALRVDALRSPQQNNDGTPAKGRRCPFSGVSASIHEDDSTQHGFESDTASTHNGGSPLVGPTDNWVTGQAAQTCPYMRYQLGLPPLRRTPPPAPEEVVAPPTTQQGPPQQQVCPYTGKVALADSPAAASAGCPFASQLSRIPSQPTTQPIDGTSPHQSAATTSPSWKDSVVVDEERMSLPDAAVAQAGRTAADTKSMFRRFRESKHTAAEITALFNKVTLKTLQRDKKELQHLAVFGTSSPNNKGDGSSEDGCNETTPPAPPSGLAAPFLSRDLAKPMAEAFMKASTNAFCERYYDLHLRMLSDSCGTPKMVTVPSFLLAAPPRYEPTGGNRESTKQHNASEAIERELGSKLLATITEAPKRTFLHDILRPLFVSRIRQVTRKWTRAVSAVLESRKAAREGCPYAAKNLEHKVWVVEDVADEVVFTIRSFSKQLRLNIMTPEAVQEVLMELLRCSHHYLLLVAHFETPVEVTNPGKEHHTATSTPCNATRASVYPAGHRFVALMLFSALTESLRFREYISSGNESTLRNTLVSELISVQKYMESAVPGIKETVSRFPGDSVARSEVNGLVSKFKIDLLPWCHPIALTSLVETTIEALALCAVFTAALTQYSSKAVEEKKREETSIGNNNPVKKRGVDSVSNPLGGSHVPKKPAPSYAGRTYAPPQHHFQPQYAFDSFHHLPFQQVASTGSTLVTCPVTGATYNVTPVHPPMGHGHHASFAQHSQLAPNARVPPYHAPTPYPLQSAAGWGGPANAAMSHFTPQYANQMYGGGGGGMQIFVPGQY